MEAFFLEDLVFAEVFGNSFDSVDLIREALFLWMTLFLTALSAKEIAAIIFSAPFAFFAKRTALSSFAKINLLTWAFLFDPLSALFAVFVTGINFG